MAPNTTLSPPDSSAETAKDGNRSLAEARYGEQIEGLFACSRKDRLTTKNGQPYLAIELRDQTATLPARIFRDADVISGKFDRGDLVEVVGRIERFRDEKQIEIQKIDRVEGADPSAFLPTAYRNLEELDGFFEHLAREVHDPQYRGLLDSIVADTALRKEFRRAPCTRNGHHAYLGGLLEHSVAVATLAQELTILHPRLNSDLLTTAALLHDIGKTREFTYGAEIDTSTAGRLVGHINLGIEIISEKARGLDEEHRLALEHCVLTHHGVEAIGGRRFGSAEALALYRVNLLDAGVKGALEHGL